MRRPTSRQSLWRTSQLAPGRGRVVKTGYLALSAVLPGGGWPGRSPCRPDGAAGFCYGKSGTGVITNLQLRRPSPLSDDLHRHSCYLQPSAW